jgi:radical SAM protein with 4Fe4S-binding SPASM domain
MVKYASKRNIYTMTSTNGHFLNDENAKRTVESGLDRLIISIDGAIQKTYEGYRKEGKLDVVLKGAENVVKWKKLTGSKNPHIIFQMLVVSHNEQEIEQVRTLANRVGVNEVKLKSAQIYDYKDGNPLIPKNEKYSRYKMDINGAYQLKHKIKDECWKMWHSAVITWDGQVVPCCFDKDAAYQMGSLQESSFRNIWTGEPYESFRRKVFSNRSKIDICSNCSEGAKTWVN